MNGIEYIRDGSAVLKKDQNGKYRVHETYKTINAAKRFTRVQPLGTVARRETIVKNHGEHFYRHLLV